MTIFKCKMCGGTLEFEQGATVGVCDSCGTRQTLPKLDDDRRANLYDRANHFRRNNEFDKAAGIYEQILNEDITDAEAYWSLVLCRYGIEYVEDPATHKRVPTVNRTQFTSVFDDDNYKSALQYADGYQRSIYEEEAAAINEIQKGILAISQKEDPFDVFICYKETDQNGRRTQDSVLANDLYHQLTQEGYKVFFSRITLEDKLGIAYEPYIFAALNSAKVMVVIGTKPEYFNAVWVKNEWSRYLALIRNGAKKILIPAYRDMDPYDLPEEFSHLQAQDMSKLGFLQDLIRGVKKLVANGPQAGKETVVVNSGNANVVPLLKRAFMSLEDGEWGKADNFCEQVLNIDPENARAYLGKLMVELRCRKQEELKDVAEPFDSHNNYKKAIRFSDDSLRSELAGYIEHITTRNENLRLDGIYTRAKNEMSVAKTESAYKEAARLFESVGEYQDASALANECYDKAEIARKDAILSDGKDRMKGEAIYSYQTAVELFESISGWKDADEKADACRRKIEEITAKDEAARLEAERKAEEVRLEAERKAEKERIEDLKLKKIITITAIAAFIWFVIVVTRGVILNSKYDKACKLYDAGKYEEAIAIFESLNGYLCSAELIEECKYDSARKLYDAGEYQEAIAAFESLNGYKDSTDQIYSIAVTLYNARRYDKAIPVFESLNGYKDSAKQIEKCIDAINYGAGYAKTSLGDIINFGNYEQDNNASNGKESIAWLVLDKQDGKLLLISKDILDRQQYNLTSQNNTWEECSLRSWLNDTFLNDAFSADEQKQIVMTNLESDNNSENATSDKVFLLSTAEAEKYFSSDEARQATYTSYAAAQCVDGRISMWWLRSPGTQQTLARCVYWFGALGSNGCYVDNVEIGVRPAIWITLNPEL